MKMRYWSEIVLLILQQALITFCKHSYVWCRVWNVSRACLKRTITILSSISKLLSSFQTLYPGKDPRNEFDKFRRPISQSYWILFLMRKKIFIIPELPEENWLVCKNSLSCISKFFFALSKVLLDFEDSGVSSGMIPSSLSRALSVPFASSVKEGSYWIGSSFMKRVGALLFWLKGSYSLFGSSTISGDLRGWIFSSSGTMIGMISFGFGVVVARPRSEGT